jgi:uncharacterized protein (TIGR04222 family)
VNNFDVNRFLMLYLVAAVAVGVAIRLHWRGRALPAQAQKEFFLRKLLTGDFGLLDDYEVALLAALAWRRDCLGDLAEDRPVCLALLKLRDAGVIGLDYGELQSELDAADVTRRQLYESIVLTVRKARFATTVATLQPLPAGSHPVESAVYDAAAGAPDPAMVRARACDAPALAEMRRRLFDLGLLVHPTRRSQRARSLLLWAIYFATWPVIAVQPPPFAWVFLLHFFAAPVAVLKLNGRVTQRGRQLLDRQSERPVVLFGFEVVWSVDPVLGLALDLPDRPRRSERSFG